jgi:hypothetical protein
MADDDHVVLGYFYHKDTTNTHPFRIPLSIQEQALWNALCGMFGMDDSNEEGSMRTSGDLEETSEYCATWIDSVQT